MSDNLQEEYEALQKIHHQALHELAGAVQIIRAYEFLNKQINSENQQLRAIVVRAKELLAGKDSGSFYDDAAALNKIIEEYDTRQHSDTGKSRNVISLAYANVYPTMN